MSLNTTKYKKLSQNHLNHINNTENEIIENNNEISTDNSQNNNFNYIKGIIYLIIVDILWVTGSELVRVF